MIVTSRDFVNTNVQGSVFGRVLTKPAVSSKQLLCNVTYLHDDVETVGELGNVRSK